MPVEYSRSDAIIILESTCPFLSESINANIWPPLSPTKIVPFFPSAICLGASKFSAKIEISKPSSNSRLDRSNAFKLKG